MKRSIVPAILCLALGVGAAGCGSDDDKSSDDAKQDTAAGGGGKATVVDMKDIQFVPMDVTVKAGDTIQWTNSDDVAHTVTKQGGPGPKFDSQNVEPGGTYEQNLTAKGKIDYLCTIHPNQKGSITVE